MIVFTAHEDNRSSIVESAPNALTTIEIRQNSSLNAASQLNNVRTLSLKISVYEDDTLQNMFGTYAFEGSVDGWLNADELYAVHRNNAFDLDYNVVKMQRSDNEWHFSMMHSDFDAPTRLASLAAAAVSPPRLLDTYRVESLFGDCRAHY